MSVINMPFAGFKDFQECMTHVKGKNPEYTDEQAGGVCGLIEKRWKEKHKNDATMHEEPMMDKKEEKMEENK